MEWTGTFEIPESGVRVGGRLTIDAGRSILTTFGALAADSSAPLVTDPWESEDIPMVWGVAEDGSRLTLLDLVPLGGNVSFPGEWTTRQEWICGSAVGDHIEPEEPVTFSSLSFGLTDLSSWLGTPRPTEDWEWKEPARLDLSVSQHEIAEVVHGDLTINFDGMWGTRRAFDEVTVTYPARITGTSSVELPWEQLVNGVVTPIEVLLWVATGRFSALEDLRVRLDGPHPTYKPLWVSLLQPRSYKPPTNRLPQSDMLFTAADIPGGVESGVEKWFNIWQDIEPAYGPVIARYRAPFTYANDRFHAAIAALESYSSHKHGKRAITKVERNQRIAQVKEALDDTVLDLTDWVLEALEMAHYHTLRTRLNLLLEDAGEISDALVGDDPDSFITAVIKSRDAYAHSAHVLGSIEDRGSLHWVSRGLNWLLRYHSLIDIGFDPDEARNRVLANHTFTQEAERMRQDLRLSDPKVKTD